MGPTPTAVAAERACLAVLDGSCHTPIAALAELAGGRLRLRALIAMPDGSRMHQTEREGPAGDPVALGRAAGEALKSRAEPAFFAALKR